MPECFPQPATCSNAPPKAQSPCKGSELKIYHDVTFGLVKVYTLSLAVHPAVDEARA